MKRSSAPYDGFLFRSAGQPYDCAPLHLRPIPHLALSRSLFILWKKCSSSSTRSFLKPKHGRRPIDAMSVFGPSGPADTKSGVTSRGLDPFGSLPPKARIRNVRLLAKTRSLSAYPATVFIAKERVGDIFIWQSALCA